jgi:NarL family two-component system response regulator LiaR
MGAKKPTSVLLVEDHTIGQEGLRSLLQGCPDIVVIGEASNGVQAILYVETLQPAVVVMDISMPKMDGITATRLIKKMHPQIAIVGLSVNAEDYQANAMHKAGASEVLTKDRAVADLYETIVKVIPATHPRTDLTR